MCIRDRLYILPYWFNPLFLSFDTLAPKRPNVKTENSRLDQYGIKPFEHQQFGTAGVEGVKLLLHLFDLLWILSSSQSVEHLLQVYSTTGAQQIDQLEFEL